MVADEVDDVGAYVARSHIGFDALNGVEHRGSRLVDVTVALGNIVDLVVGESVLAHYYGVDSVIYRRVVGYDDIRGHVANDAAATLDEHPVANFAALVHDGVGREDGALAYRLRA